MAGEKAPYFRFYAFDWDSDFTQRVLDNAGAGIYMRLMVSQWIEGSLPADPEALRLYVKAPPEEWARAWSLLEEKFPVGADGRRRNERLEHERLEMERASQLQFLRGSKGGRPRKENPEETRIEPGGNPEETRGLAGSNPEETRIEPNQEPRTKNQEPDPKPAGFQEPPVENAPADTESEFAVWWDPSEQSIAFSEAFFETQAALLDPFPTNRIRETLASLTLWCRDPGNRLAIEAAQRNGFGRWVQSKLRQDASKYIAAMGSDARAPPVATPWGGETADEKYTRMSREQRRKLGVT